MEFGGSLESFIRHEVTVIGGNESPNKLYFGRNESGVPVKDIVTLLDILGQLSAKAQRLPGPVTSYQKFRTSNHRIFLLSNIPKKIVLGFLKIGKKKLFVHDRKGACIECVPLCVLDFYIHESYQRQGCGKKLFDFMLQTEGIKPSSLAIDLPSKKMIQFLHKHYHLINPIYSPNNFVIYSEFFNEILRDSMNTRRQSVNVNSKLTPIRIWDSKNTLNSNNNKHNNKSDISLNDNILNCHRPSSSKTNRCADSSMSIEQTLLNSKINNKDNNNDDYAQSTELNNRQVNQPHTKINEMPTQLTIIRSKCSNDEKDCNRSFKQIEGTQLSEGDDGRKCFVQNDIEKTNKCDVQQKVIQNNVNNLTVSTKSDYSVLNSSGVCSYRSSKLLNRSKSSYSYISAVRNHNCHTRLW
ncbi:unnamed protein product [Trichobilharzia szidati]|nr:unnamed protein product [Trichobilharzia szidati]